MNAVDVYVGRTDGDEVIVLRSVVMAAGPTVFSAVLDWLSEGQATGIWSPGYVDVLVAGGSLDSMLARIMSMDAHQPSNEEEVGLEALRGALTHEHRYWVKAIAY